MYDWYFDILDICSVLYQCCFKSKITFMYIVNSKYPDTEYPNEYIIFNKI